MKDNALARGQEAELLNQQEKLQVKCEELEKKLKAKNPEALLIVVIDHYK